MNPIIKKSLLAGIPIGLILVFFLTGYTFVPVQLTVGSCMKDYTSPLSYQSRPSPLQSHKLNIDGDQILVCYGSPGAKGRKVFGELVPYGELWRLGANEPTRFYTTADLVVGEVVVPKGRYSMYVVPRLDNWEVYFSESLLHWGNDINGSVRSKEIGSFVVDTQINSTFVENLTVTSQDNNMIIEWENTKVSIPIVNFEE